MYHNLDYGNQGKYKSQPEEYTDGDKVRYLAMLEIALSVGIALHSDKRGSGAQEQFPESDWIVFRFLSGRGFQVLYTRNFRAE